MKKPTQTSNKIKKFCNIALVIFLVVGILSSTAGTCVLALKSGGKDTQEKAPKGEVPAKEEESKLFSPADEYDDLPNEIELSDDVVVMSEDDSEDFHDSIIGVDTDGYYGGEMHITLSGEDNPAIEDLSVGDFVYIRGEEDSIISSDRIFKIDSMSNYDGNTVVSVTEPYFEDVYDSMEISFADLLTEDNFVGAHYANGVSSYFGDVDSEFEALAVNSYNTSTVTDFVGNSSGKSYTNALVTPVNTAVTADTPTVTPLATDISPEGKDLIVEINYDFGKNSDKKDNKDDEDDELIDKSFGIKGSFGIKNLTAHMVSDIPSITNPKELYLGVSGELFTDITPYGKVSASAEMKANKKDMAFATLEGISEKRFPIAVFHFKGTTPVYITNSAFKSQNEGVLPSLYLVLYADWDGQITFELSGGFEYTNSFNSGLRIVDDGEFCCKFEDYPYYDLSGNNSQDGVNWHVNLGLDADTELTLFGASLLFYVGGVNVGEISAARLGIEAQCEIEAKASSTEGLSILKGEDTTFYIRGFLKFIEAKIKLKANGKGILSKLSVDVDYEFGLVDITLFEKGNKPDKYKPKILVSTIPPPNEFASIITLVLDVSGSMSSNIQTNQTKLDAAKDSAKTIVDITEKWAEKYEENYGIGLVKFSGDAETVSTPHIDYGFLKDSIDSMYDGGGTAIYTGIDSGVSQLTPAKSTSKVIILMTDGQDSYDSEALASAKKAAEENIRIYTIGFGQDVEEETLKKIAETTGGEYRYASTDNIVGIMGSFIYAQQSATSEVLAEYEGAVSEGETSEVTSFQVDSMEGDLNVTTVWPGSFLDTIVTDPNGRVVDEKYPGATINEATIPSTLTLKNPIRGKWSVKVKGVETSYDKEPFYTVVSFKDIPSETKTEEISLVENIASHSVPIGIYISLISVLLLLCINKKKKIK